MSRNIIQLVDTETQTDKLSIMDISESDGNASPFTASRELAMCLRDSGRGRSIEDLNLRCDADIKQRNDNSIESMDVNHTFGSPNGNYSNSMSRSDLTYQDACSGSDDPLDDAMNSNDRKRTPDDDDNLEKLGRRVSAFFTENRHSIQSTNSDNGNSTSITMMTDNINENTTTTMLTRTKAKTTSTDVVENIVNQRLHPDVKSTTARRGFVSTNEEGNEVTVIRCNSHKTAVELAAQDEFCNDSWTDEEGEDPDRQYLYLRRKR